VLEWVEKGNVDSSRLMNEPGWAKPRRPINALDALGSAIDGHFAEKRQVPGRPALSLAARCSGKVRKEAFARPLKLRVP
jgi:hypothetical protein